uniref:SIS domain-containing protein n=1 Tax=Herbidospora sakaeratensis TaxID=564415 RepID=UPI000783C4BA|nr:SIS domain-containing protein [Herbidospora sakaeratensis]
MIWEPELLDDQNHLVAADPSGMLPAVASAAAQIRTGRRLAAEAGVGVVAAEGRPRAIVTLGMGVSGVSGEILRAICGNGAPIPITTASGHRLPGWIGANDLVFAVSASGATEETLGLAWEAARRGCRLVGVGRPGSPLQSLCTQRGAPFVPVEAALGHARAALWALTVPLVVAASSLGLADVPEPVYESTATLLEDLAHRCRPSSDTFINPGKTLAMELAESVPMVWGSSALPIVAAHRLVHQLYENAKYPAIFGELPEAAHNQVAAFDGPLAERDIFADTQGRQLRLFVLRDTDEDERETRTRGTTVRLAENRDVRVSELMAEGRHPLERLATLIGLADFASVYLALGYGIDPTPVSAVRELKARIAR